MRDKLLNKKNLIIVLSIIFIAMISGVTYLLFFNEYTETANFDGTALQLPHTFFDKMETYNDNNGAKVIQNSNKYIIKYFYWDDNNLIDAVGFGKEKLDLVGQTTDTGANPVKTSYNGNIYYICFVSDKNKIEHGNILIIAKDPDTAKKSIIQ